jgi:hypothetical protein
MIAGNQPMQTEGVLHSQTAVCSAQLDSGSFDVGTKMSAATVTLCTCFQCLAGIPCWRTERLQQRQQQQQQQQKRLLPIGSRYKSAALFPADGQPEPDVAASVAEWLSAASRLAASLAAPVRSAQPRRGNGAFALKSIALINDSAAPSRSAAAPGRPAGVSYASGASQPEVASRRNKSTVMARAALARKHAKTAAARQKARCARIRVSRHQGPCDKPVIVLYCSLMSPCTYRSPVIALQFSAF